MCRGVGAAALASLYVGISYRMSAATVSRGMRQYCCVARKGLLVAHHPYLSNLRGLGTLLKLNTETRICRIIFGIVTFFIIKLSLIPTILG